MFHRHKPFFPIVLALLSIGLITLIVFATRPGDSADESNTLFTQMTAPTEREYESGMKEALAPYFSDFDTAENDGARIVIVEEALSDVLDLRLPVVYKELHLDIAVALTMIQASLRGEGGDLAAGRARLDALSQTNSWMK